MKEILINNALVSLATLTKKVGYHPTETFYVERHFLKAYVIDDVAGIKITKGDICATRFDDVEFDGLCVAVGVFSARAVEPNQTFTFLYYGGEGGYAGPGHGLVIYDECGNMLYWREIDQNPKTEWNINSMAYDLIDTNGHYIFDGDPVQY